MDDIFPKNDDYTRRFDSIAFNDLSWLNSNESIVWLSLSSCIEQIARGNIEKEKVKYIVAGTEIIDIEKFLKETSYTSDYWKWVEKIAFNLVREFFNEWKIIQPRLEWKEAHYISNWRWIKESDLVTSDTSRDIRDILVNGQ